MTSATPITATPLPAGRTIDGIDISALLTGDAKSPRGEFLYYSRDGRIEGIRQGGWKLLTGAPRGKGKPNTMLFNLANDVGEKQNLAAENPELVQGLHQRMVELDAAIAAGARPVWKKS